MSNVAVAKDAQMVLTKEECALGMGQRSSDAAVMNAQVKLIKEECASSMERRGQRRNATVKDAQI